MTKGCGWPFISLRAAKLMITLVWTSLTPFNCLHHSQYDVSLLKPGMEAGMRETEKGAEHKKQKPESFSIAHRCLKYPQCCKERNWCFFLIPAGTWSPFDCLLCIKNSPSKKNWKSMETMQIFLTPWESPNQDHSTVLNLILPSLGIKEV